MSQKFVAIVFVNDTALSLVFENILINFLVKGKSPVFFSGVLLSACFNAAIPISYYESSLSVGGRPIKGFVSCNVCKLDGVPAGFCSLHPMKIIWRVATGTLHFPADALKKTDVVQFFYTAF